MSRICACICTHDYGLSSQEKVIKQLLQLVAEVDWSDIAIQWDGVDTTRDRQLFTPAGELEKVLKWGGDDSPMLDWAMPVWSEHSFIAGRLSTSRALRCWDIILEDHPRREFIRENLEGIRPSRYFQPFRGCFMGRHYDCDQPPERVFDNHWPEGLTSTGQHPEDWV